MERIRRILENTERESYTNVIHEEAIEEWTQPYNDDDLILADETTKIKVQDFLIRTYDHRVNFLNFFELLGEIPKKSDYTKGKYMSLVLDHIAIRLSAYTKHMRRTSDIYETIHREDPESNTESESDISEADSIIWSRWLEDYINTKRYSRSREDIISMIDRYIGKDMQ